MRLLFVAAGVGAVAGIASAAIFPDTGHVANNYIPFAANQTCLMDQVFASSLFGDQTGGLPALITSIGFSPFANGNFASNITVLIGYTNAIPGISSGGGGLAAPDGSGNNFSESPLTFFSNANYSVTFNNATSDGTNFSEFVLPGSFTYNPAHGNLLVEINAITGATTNEAVSRAAGSAESSRAYNSSTYGSAESPTTATRMDFTFRPVPEPSTILALGLGAIGLLGRRRRN